MYSYKHELCKLHLQQCALGSSSWGGKIYGAHTGPFPVQSAGAENTRGTTSTHHEQFHGQVFVQTS